MSDEQDLDNVYVEQLLQRMRADLARHVQAARDDGYPHFAENLLLNFHGWGLANELEARVSTASGHAQFDAIMHVVKAGVTAASQGYPEPPPAPMH